MTEDPAKYRGAEVWVRRGSQRRAILKVMEKPQFPSEIVREARKVNPKISLNNCSDVLRGFAEEGLAVCLNPQERVGRLYALTLKGKRIRKKLIS